MRFIHRKFPACQSSSRDRVWVGWFCLVDGRCSECPIAKVLSWPCRECVSRVKSLPPLQPTMGITFSWRKRFMVGWSNQKECTFIFKGGKKSLHWQKLISWYLLPCTHYIFSHMVSTLASVHGESTDSPSTSILLQTQKTRKQAQASNYKNCFYCTMYKVLVIQNNKYWYQMGCYLASTSKWKVYS